MHQQQYSFEYRMLAVQNHICCRAHTQAGQQSAAIREEGKIKMNKHNNEISSFLRLSNKQFANSKLNFTDGELKKGRKTRERRAAAYLQ